MAQGQTIFLDNSDIWAGDDYGTSGGGIDKQISGYVATAMLHFEHIEVPTPHLFGQPGQQTSVSPHYTVNVTLDLLTDGWAASELDDIITSHMRPPLGPSAGVGEMWLWIKTSGVSVANAWTAHRAANPAATPLRSRQAPSADAPVYIGRVAVSQWDPLGSGVAGEMVRQNRAFTGTGNWFKYEGTPPAAHTYQAHS